MAAATLRRLVAGCDGDLNMRETESVAGMRDAFADAGSPGTRFTWDSFANRFHSDCFKFRCRFDRVYTSGCRTRPDVAKKGKQWFEFLKWHLRKEQRFTHYAGNTYTRDEPVCTVRLY